MSEKKPEKKRYVLTLTRDERIMVRDALDVLNPDSEDGEKMRDALLDEIECLGIDPRMIVVVDGGLIQSMDGLPAGLTVEVRDFDTDLEEGSVSSASDPRVEKFDYGLAYVTEWKRED